MLPRSVATHPLNTARNTPLKTLTTHPLITLLISRPVNALITHPLNTNPLLLLLPRAHFLVQRPRKHAPPVSLKMGYAPEYENLVGHFLLPPGGEVVHLRSQFVLPYGVILHGH